MLRALEDLTLKENFSGKGPLCVALVVTEIAKTRAFPLSVDDFLAESGGQVAGLGRAAVQSILARHGIERVLAEEGGRTSRGSIGKMKTYVAFLNDAHRKGALDLTVAERFWIEQVREFFAAKPLKLRMDSRWSLRTIVRQLVSQAAERQAAAAGSMLVGTMMQHLVGAKLEVVLGTKATIQHRSANNSDQLAGVTGDFDLGDVSIHVTSTPGETLLRKCEENIHAGRRPIVITSRKGVAVIEGLAENIGIADAIDIIEFEQFIATNVHELGVFTLELRRKKFDEIVNKYNEIVSEHETDPSLRIEIAAGKT